LREELGVLDSTFPSWLRLLDHAFGEILTIGSSRAPQNFLMCTFVFSFPFFGSIGV
jgi:hypothetical protein